MATNPFERVIINRRERPLSGDINEAQSQIDHAIRELAMRMFQGRTAAANDSALTPLTGFVGEALKVRPSNPASMVVRLPSGLGFMYDAASWSSGIDGIDDLCPWKPIVLMSDLTITIGTAPGSPNSRYDIIEVINKRVATDSASRDVLNETTGIFDPTIVQKTLSPILLSSDIGTVVAPADSTTPIGYKKGIASSGTPAVPATTSGYTKIAQILVGSGVSTIDADVIQDLRKMLYPGNVLDFSAVVSMPTASTTVPTLSAVQAPPGVQAVAVGTAFANGQVTLYVFGGNFDVTEPPAVVVGITGGIPSAVVQAQGNPSFTTIDSSMQTAIAGVNASTATKVAIGRPVLKIPLASYSAVSLPNPIVYQVQVRVRGG